MNERRLTLYTRPGCELCDEMAGELEAWLTARDITVEVVNVDTDAELQARFGRDVPLLFAGNNEICRHVLNPIALDGWEQSRRSAH